MNSIWQDARFGFRMLWKRPGFTSVALLVLALGVGANTAIFSVVNAVLLRPLPYPGAERVVAFTGVNPPKGITSSNMSSPDFADWLAQQTSFEALSLYTAGSANLTGGDEPERVSAAGVTPDFFRVVGVGAARGRALLADDAQAGHEAVAVIGHGLWVRRFGADPGIVGRRIEISGRSLEVVGVMPPGFDFPQRSEVWAALRLDPSKDQRDNRSFFVVGRLKDGATLERAQAEMDALTARLAQEYPVTNGGWGVRLQTLRDNLVGQLRTTLFVLMAAVGLVLLIACANVANLLLARAASRRREVAVRLALGAGRMRIVRQMLTESVLLALTGGALGVGLSVWLKDLLVALAPAGTPRIDEVSTDARVLLFALGATLLTGLVFGLAPALQASRPDLGESLKEGGRGAADVRSRMRSLLVIGEVALSLVLLVGAGLLLKSFARLQRVNPGFDSSNVLTLRLSLPSARYREPRDKAEFYSKLIAGIEALPGVESAGATLSLPLGGSNYDVWHAFVPEGRALTPENSDNAAFSVVTPDYFRALRIPVLHGRAFTERDDDSSTKVVIINEPLARKVFPGEDPLGKHLTIWRDEKFPREIVGVVGEAKPQGLDADPKLQIYVPHRQDASWGSLSLVVRARGDMGALTQPVRGEVRALDRELPVYDVKTMRQVVSDATAYQRVTAVLMAGFALAALLLAGVGLYGVVSYTVAQRTREFGIRVALGAQGRDILRLVLRQGGALVLAGVVAGVAGALAATRVLASLLYGVSATDATVFVLVPALLACVALIACLVPARRATRVDPMAALRHE
ncbi:MAG: ABC transporter permease [Acidobacteriota bacterium]|nr:ABC transporter permease [Acidobacteriota bacterium]MDQ5837188.1 ABC transporter permease [Acidobacteriota bacterium]